MNSDMVAFVWVAVAFADIVAVVGGVLEPSDRIVVPAGIPGPLIECPTSTELNPAALDSVADPNVVPASVIVRAGFTVSTAAARIATVGAFDSVAVVGPVTAVI